MAKQPKKPAAKKTAAKKAAKKTAAKKTAAKQPKAAGKAAAAKKAKAAAKKSAGVQKAPAAKKPNVKKTATKTPAAKKDVTQTASPPSPDAALRTPLLRGGGSSNTPPEPILAITAPGTGMVPANTDLTVTIATDRTDLPYILTMTDVTGGGSTVVHTDNISAPGASPFQRIIPAAELSSSCTFKIKVQVDPSAGTGVTPVVTVTT